MDAAAAAGNTPRLDERVIDHYRAQGEGWQSRINDDLKKLTGSR